MWGKNSDENFKAMLTNIISLNGQRLSEFKNILEVVLKHDIY